MSSGCDPIRSARIAQFLDAGGGVLVALGDKVDASFANASLFSSGAGWLPAQFGATRGDAESPADDRSSRSCARSSARPSRRWGSGDSPPLAGADLFEYRVLEPAKGASVTARLDTGDPWIVERPLAAAAWPSWPDRSTPKAVPCRSIPTSSPGPTS